MSKSDENKIAEAKVVKTDAEWRQQLSDMQFRVARRHATEPAFTGASNWDAPLGEARMRSYIVDDFGLDAMDLSESRDA